MLWGGDTAIVDHVIVSILCRYAFMLGSVFFFFFFFVLQILSYLTVPVLGGACVAAVMFSAFVVCRFFV
jgi:hypothetical protein